MTKEIGKRARAEFRKAAKKEFQKNILLNQESIGYVQEMLQNFEMVVALLEFKEFKSPIRPKSAEMFDSREVLVNILALIAQPEYSEYHHLLIPYIRDKRTHNVVQRVIYSADMPKSIKYYSLMYNDDAFQTDFQTDEEFIEAEYCSAEFKKMLALSNELF